MANKYWVGGATAVAQVTSVQITGYDVATTYKITVGSVVISTVGTGGTVNTTATALAAAWNASTHPYCAAVTALASTDTVTFTADTAGVPFVITPSVTGGTGTIGSATAVTANAGPNDWSTATNWSDGAIPANSDNVFIRNTSVPILWGLAQSGVTPTLLSVDQTYTAQIGLPYHKFATSVSGSTVTYSTSTVIEYRQASLAIGAATVRIGENYSTQGATGASLIKIDLGTTNATIFIFNTGRGFADDALPPVRIKDTHISSTMYIYGDQSFVGVVSEIPGDTGQFSQITVFSGNVIIGAGVTLATLDCQGGTTTTYNAITTVRSEAGSTVKLAGAGTPTIGRLEERGNVKPITPHAITVFTG